jgi:hypothetical protein
MINDHDEAARTDFSLPETKAKRWRDPKCLDKRTL